MANSPELSHLLPTGEVIWRLGSATVVGAIIGLNRELRHKPAGLRTQALVTLGSATATLVISELASVGGIYDVSAVSRVIQGVLTGIGFLGGGVILRDTHEHQVQGLTTAASIWISATLGLTCGVGLWGLALVVLVLALAVLRGGTWVEERLRRQQGLGPPPPGTPGL